MRDETKLTRYEVVGYTVDHMGMSKSVRMIRNAETLEPHFPSSIWLLGECHRKPRGYDQLSQHVARFFTFAACQGLDPLDVDRYFLEAYCDKHLFQQRGLSSSTVKQYHTSIAAFYRAMERLGFIEKEVEVKRYISVKLQDAIDLDKGIRNSLDPFNLYARYLAAEDYATLVGNVQQRTARLRRRDELIIRTAYETGCRGAEIVDQDNFSTLRLQKSLKKAMDLGKSEFLHDILGKGSGLGKPRKIAIPTALAREILRYVDDYGIRAKSAFCSLDNRSLHPSHPSKVFKRCKDAIILNGSASTPNLDIWIRHEKSRTFHGLRHTYATNLARKLRQLGESYELIRERLGHTQIETTNVYINFDILLHGSVYEQNKVTASIGRGRSGQGSGELIGDE